ncbi:hypothetical protein I4F81_012610 [Pyropia yezoensis]|uniref:Uncharacterized protein n=1 Tax=Pyropia yezoensis TaxID=2788 RepID=A0ACC3CJR0_PYRYE|nr:hypothetical protein I4F81_012610 [Neopyropia yezoensis]
MVSTVPASHVDQGQGVLSSCTSGVICTYHCCSVAEGLYYFFGGYDFFVDGCFSLVKGLMAAAQVARVDAAPPAVARPATPPEGLTPASAAHGASRAPCAAERVAGPSARRRASGLDLPRRGPVAGSAAPSHPGSVLAVVVAAAGATAAVAQPLPLVPRRSCFSRRCSIDGRHRSRRD